MRGEIEYNRILVRFIEQDLRFESFGKNLKHLVTLATKFLDLFLFHGDIIKLEPQMSGPWYTCDLNPHRVSATRLSYTNLDHYVELSQLL